ncbi:methyltransferase domain-containing protein [Candidatus Woesearchaeota archaeon]|nr:methyltransferase domain-containing protein [Candidatus Woesearchaeota archaeon]
MNKTTFAYWNKIAEKNKKHHLEKNIAKYKKEEHISLIKKWTNNNLKNKKILKTDLYEETFKTDSFMDWLQKESDEVFGIDVSETIVNKATNNYPKTKFFRSDIEKLPFKDNYFNVIISNSTLDHFPKYKMIKALKEMKRVLKPKGKLILTLDNKENKKYYFFYQIRKLFSKPYYQERCYSVKEVQEIIGELNLKINNYTSIVHIPTPFNKIANILNSLKLKIIDKLIKKLIIVFKSREKSIRTGWFLAFEITKK